MVRSGGVLFASLVPVAARVSPAGDFDDRTARLQIDSVVAAIGVGLKIAVESFQEVLRTGVSSRFGEVVDFVWMIMITQVRTAGEAGLFELPLG